MLIFSNTNNEGLSLKMDFKQLSIFDKIKLLRKQYMQTQVSRQIQFKFRLMIQIELNNSAFFIYFNDLQFKLSLVVIYLKQKDRRLAFIIQMFKHQGTTFQYTNKAEELVEDVKPPTYQQLSKNKQGQNPEHHPPDQKQQSHQDNPKLRQKISKLWRQLSTLKKGLAIGGIILFVIIVILFSLLMVSLRSKPRFIIISKGSTPYPNSNKQFNEYFISMQRRRGIFQNTTTSNMSISTISNRQTTGRATQQNNEGQGLLAIVQFQDMNDGITIKALNSSQLEATVNVQQMLKSSFQNNRRLLYQLQMRAALRKLQYQGSGNSFANPQAFTNGLQNSLRDGLAQVLQASHNDVEIQQAQQVTIKRNKEGKFVIDQDSQKSSRLLNVLEDLRYLQEGQDNYFGLIFKQVVNNTLKRRLVQAKDQMELLTDPQNIKNMENDELRSILLNSNLNGEVDIIISSGDSNARLLQQTIENGVDIATNLASQQKGQTKPKNKIKRKCGTSRRRCRPVENSQYKDCTRCCKKGNKTQCDKSVVADLKSIYYVEGITNQKQINNSTLQRRRSIRRPNIIKKRRIQRRRRKQDGSQEIYYQEVLQSSGMPQIVQENGQLNNNQGDLNNFNDDNVLQRSGRRRRPTKPQNNTNQQKPQQKGPKKEKSIPKKEQKPIPKNKQKSIPKKEQKTIPKNKQKPNQQKPTPKPKQQLKPKPKQTETPKIVQKPKPKLQQKSIPKNDQKPKSQPTAPSQKDQKPKSEQKPVPKKDQTKAIPNNKVPQVPSAQLKSSQPLVDNP